MRRHLLPIVATGVAIALTPPLAVGTAHAASLIRTSGIAESSSEGLYKPTTPTRVFDSRTSSRLTPNNPVSVPVAGRGEVPSDGVSAVVINLTASRPSAAGYLTAYSSTASAGGTSSLLFARGEARANLVTVPVGSDGSIKLLDGGGAGAGTVDAIVDVQGYYLDGTNDVERTRSALCHVSPWPYRLLDTRVSGGALAPNSTRTVTFDKVQLTDEGLAALAVNITAVSSTAAGYLTAWDGTSARPDTSNLNFSQGRTTPNNAIVPLTRSADGKTQSFKIFNGSSGSTQILVDVVGAYYDFGSQVFGERFVPLATPKRIVDTRTRIGTTRLGPRDDHPVSAPKSVLPGPTGGRIESLVGSVTAVRPSTNTYLTIYPLGQKRPVTSYLNPYAGQTVANHAFIPLSYDDATFNIYNSAGSTDVLVDVVGRFEDTDPYSHTDASQR